MNKRSILRVGAALLAGTVLMATGSFAQDYPTKPITVIVPFAAGGPTDTVSRLIAEAMGEELGQQMLVQNVGGAGGTLGAGQAAAAPNDGYTLLIHHIGLATSPALYSDLPFDPVTDLAPIGLITDVPMTVIARKDFEPQTLPELVDYIKANGDKITYGHAGIGAASHLCGMLLMEAVGTQMTSVPYTGTGPAMTDLLGGQIDMMCDQTTNTTSQILGGEVKAYAVTTPERLAALPDVPTAKEGGLDLQVGVWHALYAPAGTDQAIIDRLEKALQAALKKESIATRFAELGTFPVSEDQATPAALAEKLSSEIVLWKGVVEAAGVFAE